jgi:putative oxidoreductase
MHPLDKLQDTLALVGRLLIGWLFVPAGIGKIMGFAGTAGYIASKGMPLPEVCAAIAIAAELGLGLLIVVGWQTRWAALGLGLFTLVISFIFHNFWAVDEAQRMMQKMNFDKNLAIVGGLFALAAWGAGVFSLDGRREPVVSAKRSYA